eukprot:10858756-Alexandrium_andersonii.AAC.1
MAHARGLQHAHCRWGLWHHAQALWPEHRPRRRQHWRPDQGGAPTPLEARDGARRQPRSARRAVLQARRPRRLTVRVAAAKELVDDARLDQLARALVGGAHGLGEGAHQDLREGASPLA